MTLTYILLDLMEQHSARKRELLDTLVCLESQRENEQRDFWLLQYQKLLDAQPGEQSFRATSIDPMLGYNFLLNGVVHCIPFLSRLWKSDKCNIMDITDNDLIEAGIKNASDREKILQSINDFLKLEKPSQVNEAIPTSQAHAHEQPQKHTDTPPSAPQTEQSNTNESQTETANGEMESECVICMEESVSGCNNEIKIKTIDTFNILSSIFSVQNHIPAMWPFVLLSELPYYHRYMPDVSINY